MRDVIIIYLRRQMGIQWGNLETQWAAVEITNKQSGGSKRLGIGSPSSEESFTQEIKWSPKNAGTPNKSKCDIFLNCASNWLMFKLQGESGYKTFRYDEIGWDLL